MNMWGVIIITLISILGKLIEDCRKILVTSRTPNPNRNVRAFYECYNIHLGLSLGMLGFFWGVRTGGDSLICLLFIILFGIVSKGVFSGHKPVSLRLNDRDAFWGLYVPNACGIAAAIYVWLLLN